MDNINFDLLKRAELKISEMLGTECAADFTFGMKISRNVNPFSLEIVGYVPDGSSESFNIVRNSIASHCVREFPGQALVLNFVQAVMYMSGFKLSVQVTIDPDVSANSLNHMDISVVHSAASTFLDAWNAGDPVTTATGINTDSRNTEQCGRFERTYPTYNLNMFDTFGEELIAQYRHVDKYMFVKHLSVDYTCNGFRLTAQIYCNKASTY